jgi:hypothetical protein
MITGAHLLLYSKKPEEDRQFLRDVLGLRAVDSGGGWLIFALPPAELGVHPGSGGFVQRHAEQELLGSVLYLMCGDLSAEILALRARGVECSEPETAAWGLVTSLPLPSGGRLGLYQPTHRTALELS